MKNIVGAIVIFSLLSTPTLGWTQKDRSGSCREPDLFNYLIERDRRRDEANKRLSETLRELGEQRRERLKQEKALQEAQERADRVKGHIQWVLDLIKNSELTPTEKNSRFLERMAEDPDGMIDALNIIKTAQRSWDTIAPENRERLQPDQ